MIRATQAEWFRLTRARPLAVGLLGTAGLAIVITTILLMTTGAQVGLSGLSTTILERPDGALRPISTGLSYAAIVLFAVAVAVPAGGFARGTWRTELLHQPRRCTLAGGQLLARWAFTSLLLVTAMMTGIGTAMALAPSQNLDTSAWFSTEAVLEIARQTALTCVFAGGWTVFGTLLAVWTRSVSIGLGVGLLWTGPVENILGDELSFAPHWFPGLLLRVLVTPAADTDLIRVGVTLGIYVVIALAATAILLRRDVT